MRRWRNGGSREGKPRALPLVAAVASAALLLAAALIGLPGEARAADLAGSCWSVYWLSTGADPNDAADEVVCFDGGIAARVRESFTFGTIVQECGKASVEQSDGGFTVTVDYSACEGLPTHTIACPAPNAARLKCSWTYNPSGETQTMDAWLVREGS